MRSSTLLDAHWAIFNTSPCATASNWQVAAKIMEGFDLRLLDRELAKRCIFVICNQLGPPMSKEKRDVVELALHNGRQFWPQIPFEILLSQMPALEKAETDD